jgi:TatD DNase family protein
MIDSHAHLTDERFTGEIEDVLQRAIDSGLQAIVTVGTRVGNSRDAAALAATSPLVYATAGIHPHYAEQATNDAFDQIRELAAQPRVVAIGETGLDYHYDNAPREVQRQSFERHLTLAAEIDLPVVVHAREADDDVISILRHAPPGVRGVLHCFSSGPALLEAGLELGWYISFAGMITFPRYEDADLLKRVPLDRLLVETDSPYLAPVPHRGRRNEPAHVVLVARRMAELRGETFETVAAAAVRNAREFYRLPS